MTERTFRIARSLASVAVLVVAAGLLPPSPLAAAPAQEHDHEQQHDYLYVASQSGPAVSVIDTETLEVVEVIDLTELGFSANAKPHHTAVEPDGSHWYVSLIADGYVLKFDRDNELVGRAAFETPGLLAVDPERDVLYVGRSMAAVSPPQRIGVIDRSSMEIEETDVFFPRPHAIVVAPGGGVVYVASLAENRMAVLEPAEEEIELLGVEGEHMHTFVQFAISPDGGTLVTGGEMTGQVLVFDRSDPWEPQLRKSIEVGAKPWHPTFSLDGSRVYFPLNLGNGVVVVDTGSWEVVETITHPALSEPHGSAISADGRYLFVAGRNTAGEYDAGAWDNGLPNGTVVVIDTDTHEVVKVLTVPPYAAGMSTRAR